jgi:hypothetical protein
MAQSYRSNQTNDRTRRVREFVLRFRKTLNLHAKYVDIINDPNDDWTHLTYKNLISSLVKIIREDENPPIPYEETAKAAKEISKTAADKPELWVVLRDLLDNCIYLPPNMNHPGKSEGEKLELVGWLLDRTLMTTTFRNEMERAYTKGKNNTAALNKEKKTLKVAWDEAQKLYNKERRTLKAADRDNFNARYAAAKKSHDQLLINVEKKYWFSGRKLQNRTMPLGVDTLGSTYWLFHTLDREDDDWGHWIVIEKNQTLPHPSGAFPPPPTIPSDNGMDPNAPAPSQPEDEETVKGRIWYAVSEPENIRHLAEWVKFNGEMAIYWQEVAKTRPMTPGPSVPTSPNGKGLGDTIGPSKQSALEIHVHSNIKRGTEAEDVVEGKFMPLVEQLKRIAEYMDEDVAS